MAINMPEITVTIRMDTFRMIRPIIYERAGRPKHIPQPKCHYFTPLYMSAICKGGRRGKLSKYLRWSRHMEAVTCLNCIRIIKKRGLDEKAL